MSRIQCPRCRHRRSYNVRRGNRICTECRYEWNPKKKLPLRLTRSKWKQILKLFVLGLSSNQISEQTNISKQRIIRALTCTRKAIVKDVPKVFSGIVEVDETYVGGKWKNKRKSEKAAKKKIHFRCIKVG